MTQPTGVSRGVAERARQSGGTSEPAIYRMIQRTLEAKRIEGETLIDVGCGTGELWRFLCARFSNYIGVDAVRYEGFPKDQRFVESDLDERRVPLDDQCGDLVAATETIEHLENPRAFFRELTRLTKTGGHVLVTTPNQLSILSLATLAVRKRYSAFQDVHYPSHITALLEIDLRRMAHECGLRVVAVSYSLEGRIVFTPLHYPKLLSRIFPRACSDNVLLLGRKDDT